MTRKVLKNLATLQLTSASTSVRLQARLHMNRQKAISNRFLFGALFAGLNLLCFLGIVHGWRVVHHTRVNYSHVPAHGLRRSGSRDERTGLIASADAAIEHTLTVHPAQSQAAKMLRSGSSVTPQAAVAPALYTLPALEESHEPLARENVLALGSAPRAPGLGRAPPTA